MTLISSPFSFVLSITFYKFPIISTDLETIFPVVVLSAAGGIKVNQPDMSSSMWSHSIFLLLLYLKWSPCGFQKNSISCHVNLLSFWEADIVVLVAVVILVALFSMQHYGTDRVGWLFAPIVLLWFLLIGGIGIFNIWKYGSTVLKAFSPVYIYRYFRRGGKEGWTSLGGIMLSITGK